MTKRIVIEQREQKKVFDMPDHIDVHDTILSIYHNIGEYIRKDGDRSDLEYIVYTHGVSVLEQNFDLDFSWVVGNTDDISNATIHDPAVRNIYMLGLFDLYECVDIKLYDNTRFEDDDCGVMVSVIDMDTDFRHDIQMPNGYAQCRDWIFIGFDEVKEVIAGYLAMVT